MPCERLKHDGELSIIGVNAFLNPAGIGPPAPVHKWYHNPVPLMEE